MTNPADWTDPEPECVSPGVFRLALPLATDSLRAVNVYVLAGPDGLLVIDSGWANPQSRSALDAGLHALGHGLDDVAEFLVTHAHWDHYTQAVSLRQEFGVRVRLGRGERRSIEDYDPAGSPFAEQADRLVRCGVPELAERIAAVRMSPEQRSVPIGPPDFWLDDRATVALADRTLEVFATPGHTRGHIVLRDAAAGLLFAGDHVLPHITPSIGLETAPQRRPLRSYLDSLRLVRDQPDLRLLPAHGPVTPSVHLRIDELLAHHAQRLELVLSLVRNGHPDAYRVAAAMTWTRRERSLAELDLFNQMLAVLEVQAHLDVLADTGAITCRDGAAPVVRYDAC